MSVYPVNSRSHTLNDGQMDRLDRWMDKYIDWGTARERGTHTLFYKNEITFSMI